jgi:hypothetical protein
MRLVVTLTSVALLLSTGYAIAQQKPNTMTSGRPSAVLTEAQCQEVWQKAVPDGDSLAQANAGPYVVNFAQIDADGNGAISVTEFQTACGKGMIKYTAR